jgi:hypothetical protein
MTYMRWSARVAPYLWWLVISMALALALWFAGRSTVRSIRQDERARVLAEGEAFGSWLAQTKARRDDAIAKAHVDTVRVRVMVERRRVDTLVLRVPDSLKAVPEVAALIAGVRRLTTQVDSLDRALNLERAASQMRAQVDSAAIVSLRIVVQGKDAEIASLKKRPRWRTVALGVVGSAAAGYLVGVVR